MIDGERYFFGDSGTDISETTATANTVLSGFYFYTSDGTKTEGSITTRSASSTTVTGSQTYYSGYYPSNWTVSGLDTSDATAAAKNIEEGFTAYVNGVKIVGTCKGIIHGLVKPDNAPTSLSVARKQLAATSIGNYALFGGGGNTVDAYNTSLSRSTPTVLSVARSQLAATSIGDYALFGGGYGSYNTVDAYNTSLVRSTATVLSVARKQLAATSIGNYALFGGGYSDNTMAYLNTVDAYNTSLVRSTPTALSEARYNLAATSVGDYALFGGGYTGSSHNTVDAYNISLVRSTATSLTAARMMLTATSIEEYALFGGGSYDSSGFYNRVDAYNTSLSRSTPTELSQARNQLAATSIGDYTLFGGGWAYNYSGGSTYYNTVDAYDTSLSRSTPATLFVARRYLVATSVGNYALFGGGEENNNPTNTVDAYYQID